MNKDFDTWNTQKKSVHDHRSYPYFKQREIWWCLLGTNIGFEQDGDVKEYQRPALVLKGLSAHTCFIIPITSSLHKHPLRIPLGIIEEREATAVISQLRVIDTKRLMEKICMLDENTFKITRKAIKDLL